MRSCSISVVTETSCVSGLPCLILMEIPGLSTWTVASRMLLVCEVLVNASPTGLVFPFKNLVLLLGL